MTSYFLISDSFLMENLMVRSFFQNNDFLEFLGIKFETNQYLKNVKKSQKMFKSRMYRQKRSWNEEITLFDIFYEI